MCNDCKIVEHIFFKAECDTQVVSSVHQLIVEPYELCLRATCALGQRKCFTVRVAKQGPNSSACRRWACLPALLFHFPLLMLRHVEFASYRSNASSSGQL
uniref:Uncharacterized protein n=1 Tax=Chrysotila carterae TaxID=13221 RepID=A0A7S4BI89_CHRCT